MIEFQEFKVFWEKLKKWMVRIQNVSVTFLFQLFLNATFLMLSNRRFSATTCTVDVVT